MKSILPALLLVASFALGGCATDKIVMSTALEKGEIHLSDYPHVVIYDAKKAAMIEVELDRIMTSHGFEVIGGKETKKHDKVLGVRYLERETRRDGRAQKREVTLTFEDVQTDKTLLAIHANQKLFLWSTRKPILKDLSEKFTEALAATK